VRQRGHADPQPKERALTLKIARRLGVSPRERGSLDNGSCPDIFELTDGRLAVIGTDVTVQLTADLPADAAIADYERIVVISRDTLIRAKGDISRLV
jgi:hypothetical protein